MKHGSLFILVRRLAISLALGVLLTIGSSWVIACTARVGGGVNSLPSGIGDTWSYWVDRGMGTVIVKRIRAHFEMKEPLKHDYLVVRARSVPKWSAVYRQPRESEPFGVTFMEDARGWPLLAMSSESQITRNDQGGVNVVTHDGIAFNMGSGQRAWRAVLPLRPMWPQFVLSVLIYTAVGFLLAFGPGITRRLVRRKTGHCEKCGYNLRGVTRRIVCPECGTSSRIGAAVEDVH